MSVPVLPVRMELSVLMGQTNTPVNVLKVTPKYIYIYFFKKFL